MASKSSPHIISPSGAFHATCPSIANSASRSHVALSRRATRSSSCACAFSSAIAAAAIALEKAQAQLLERVARLDKATWEREAEFAMDGHVAWKAPLGEMMWGLLFDAIHHRGQLSTYIRPMGGKVPSIYGPSADDPGA